MRQIAGAALAVLISSSAFAAAPTSVSDIANYAGADRQTILEAGARKEGTVQLYGTGTQDEPMYARFRAKYPWLKLEAYRAPATDVARRAMEEDKAGRNTVDAFILSTAALGVLRNAKLLQPYTVPDIAVFAKYGIEPGRNWIYDYQSWLGLGYNSKLISEDEVPKTYDDLLDPKWKGKMAISDWTSTTANWVGVVIQKKSEDYVLKLGQQNMTAFAVSPRAVANFIVSGENPISPVIYSSHMNSSKREGASVAWKALGPSFAQVGAAAVAAKAPHPNAALLLIEFYLSKEGQTLRQELGYASARTDMVNVAKPPDEAVDLTLLPDYEVQFEKWSALALKAFGKGREVPPEKK
jgi:iron(III) transport system substrate-binding protein